MCKLLLSILCAIGIFSNVLVAQERTCGTDNYLAERLANDPDFNKLFSTYQKDKTGSLYEAPLACDTSNTVIIPVAVHYNFPVNCSNLDCLRDVALAQIQVFNDDFGASNTDIASYTDGLNGICPSSYPLSRAPTINDGSCIQFRLASKNHPTGYNLSNGDPAITIGLNTWPSAGPDWAGYLNIFVSDAPTAGQTNSTLGISALPGNADGDGLWISYRSFGGPGFNCTSGVLFNSNNTYNLGRTGTHEVGHYLGLYHVFQGSDCGDDDSNPPGPIDVNDTPVQSSPHYGCPSVTNCSNVPAACSGSTDNFYSFMDYSNDDCMVMFTSDQSKVINYWGNFLNFIPDSIVCDNNPYNTALCNGPTCGDGIQNGNEIGIDCGGTYCGQCNYICGDTFMDSGGMIESYYSNEDLNWTICADGSNVVQLNFALFDIEEGGPSGCYDKLELFDGPDANSVSLGIFCGNEMADAPGGGSIYSTGNCLTINFKSDNSVNKIGWEANVSCFINSVVPVDLTSFNATLRNRSVVLDWTTEQENNNKGFHIERKKEGDNFARIAWRKALQSTAQVKKYHLIDRDIEDNSSYYYRLAQEDIDGSLNYSDVVSIKTSQVDYGKIFVNPNPSSDLINVSITLENEQLELLGIYSKVGQLIMERTLDGGHTLNTTVSLKDFAPGMYILRLKTNQTAIVKRITKK